MSLQIYLPPPERAERPNARQRLGAVLGLTGLVLAWAVVLLPCALWLLFSLVVRRPEAPSVRQQA
ncbi:MAG: hypothetical protein J7521_03285 [Caulobacter sp.]|nr:hypothetical protein [Caulobacter sp.]